MTDRDNSPAERDDVGSSRQHDDARADAPRRERDRDDDQQDRDDDRPRRDDRKPDRKQSDDQGKGQDEGKKKDDKNGGKKKSKLPLIILAIVVLLALIGGGFYWWLTRNEESTDDAYTEGRAVSMATKVSGYVVELNVNDNQFVHKGDLLIRIDPRDYITARDQAKANLDLARAQLTSAQLDLEIAKVREPASLQQAQAQLTQTRANQQNAQLEYRRQHSVDPRATTQSNIDTANAQLQTAAANVQSAQAQVSIASLVQQNIEVAEATVKQRQANLEQAEANLAQAEVNLSYTEIRAPQDGRVTRRNVELGNFAQAGQQVFYIVTPEIWVTANFKETQLDRMRPGQHVRMSIDAYPDLELRGHVDSIQMGSGARFSAFPAENATGNFVKIVRRVPVKIIIDSGLNPNIPLPLGLSVVPTVDLQ